MSTNETTGRSGFRTFLGLRYVPIIKGAWDSTLDYEALSVVTYEGNSYTSKIPVPAGVPVSNTEYWVRTGDYNVQVANLQNKVETAINQIMDYATDFNKFKTEMLKSYEDFEVDGEKKVQAKVDELDTFLKSKYNAFQAYVNKALSEHAQTIENLSEDTKAKYNAFVNTVNTNVDEGLTNIRNTVTTSQSNFETKLNNAYAQLKKDVNALVLDAGNPSECSAEIVLARGDYETLGDRLNALNDTSIVRKVLTANSQGYINLNDYSTMGTYTAKTTSIQSAIRLLGAPSNVTANIISGVVNLTVMNHSSTTSTSNGVVLNTVVQNLEVVEYEGNNSTIRKTIKATRFKHSASWSRWVVYNDNEHTIVPDYTIDRRELNTQAQQYEYSFDFNAPEKGKNKVLYHAGFTSMDAIENAPSGLAESTPFSLITVASPDISSDPYEGFEIEKYQMCMFGSGNECYVRSTINGVWTDWSRLATDADILGLRELISVIDNRITKLEKDVNVTIKDNSCFDIVFGKMKVSFDYILKSINKYTYAHLGFKELKNIGGHYFADLELTPYIDINDNDYGMGQLDYALDSSIVAVVIYADGKRYTYDIFSHMSGFYCKKLDIFVLHTIKNGITDVGTIKEHYTVTKDGIKLMSNLTSTLAPKNLNIGVKNINDWNGSTSYIWGLQNEESFLPDNEIIYTTNYFTKDITAMLNCGPAQCRLNIKHIGTICSGPSLNGYEAIICVNTDSVYLQILRDNSMSQAGAPVNYCFELTFDT